MTGGFQQGDQSVSLDLLKQKMASFAKERDWDQFHSPRNLLLALLGIEAFLSTWSANASLFCDDSCKWVKWENCRRYFSGKERYQKGCLIGKKKKKVHVGEELSDVLLYLVRLSDVCGIDLGKAALRKVELNAIKYPASKTYSNANNGIAETS